MGKMISKKNILFFALIASICAGIFNLDKLADLYDKYFGKSFYTRLNQVFLNDGKGIYIVREEVEPTEVNFILIVEIVNRKDVPRKVTSYKLDIQVDKKLYSIPIFEYHPNQLLVFCNPITKGCMEFIPSNGWFGEQNKFVLLDKGDSINGLMAFKINDSNFPYIPNLDEVTYALQVKDQFDKWERHTLNMESITSLESSIYGSTKFKTKIYPNYIPEM